MCSIAVVVLLLGIHLAALLRQYQVGRSIRWSRFFALTVFFTAFLRPFLNRNTIPIREKGLSSLAVIGLVLIFSFDSKYRFGIILGLFLFLRLV